MSTLSARLPLALILVCAMSAPAAAQLIPGWDTKQFTFEQIDANTIRLMREVEVNGEAGGPNAGQQIFADELLWNMTTGEFTAPATAASTGTADGRPVDHVFRLEPGHHTVVVTSAAVADPGRTAQRQHPEGAPA